MALTPDELAAAAADAVAAGAEAVHLHPRDGRGDESLHGTDVGAAVGAVRQACPGVPVGVSTGLWITAGDAGTRRDLVAGWADLPAARRPDFASVNVGEPGFADLAVLLHAAGVAVEAGVWSAADAQALTATSHSGASPPLLRVLVEVLDTPADAAVPAAEAILGRLDELGSTVPRLLHGEEAACWPLVRHAGRLGLPTRIGLEDTLVGPRGEPVRDNAQLVRLALVAWTGQSTISTAVPAGGLPNSAAALPPRANSS